MAEDSPTSGTPNANKASSRWALLGSMQGLILHSDDDIDQPTLPLSKWESFSKVVLKTVRKRGTAADMEEGFKRLPTLSEEQADAVAESMAWANNWLNYPNP